MIQAYVRAGDNTLVADKLPVVGDTIYIQEWEEAEVFDLFHGDNLEYIKVKVALPGGGRSTCVWAFEIQEA